MPQPDYQAGTHFQAMPTQAEAEPKPAVEEIKPEDTKVEEKAPEAPKTDAPVEKQS